MPTYALVPPGTPTQYPAINLVDEDGTVITAGGGGSSSANSVASQVDVGQSTIPRHNVQALSCLTGNQIVRLTYFTAYKSETVTQVRVYSGTTAAAATPSLIRIGLYEVAANGNLTLQASTPNDTTLFAAASTSYTKAFSASYAVVSGQRYAMGLLVVSGATTPSIMGQNAILAAEANNIAPRLCATLVTQTDLPASITSGSLGSGSTSIMYMVILP